MNRTSQDVAPSRSGDIVDLLWRHGALLLVGLFILAIFANGLNGEYQRFVGIQVLVSALVAISFRGLFRIGVFSLAGPGFMGLGAYAYALLQLEAGVAPPLALLGSLAACLAIGVVAGPIVWRVNRIYLALLTLSLVVILTMIYGELRITGGHGGRYGVAPVVSAGSEGWNWFAFCLALSGFILAGLAILEKSPLGRAWRAIGVDTAYAESVGVRSNAHSYWAFVLYSLVAASAGIMLAGNNGYVYPEAFGFERVVFMLLCVYVGGVASFAGPLVGALFVGWLQESLSAYEQYTMFILGSTLVLVVLVFPNGIASIPGMVVRQFKRRVDATDH
ncbi:MAG: branched-chain amino acid ABC transporter permease [Rhizobiaceae bacterium]